MERSTEATGTPWEGLAALDREGAHLGTCVRTFSDSGVGTTVSEWVVVDVDGRGPSVLPGRDATEVDGGVQLDVVRAVVLEAPAIGDVVDLTDQAIAALAFHYALSDTEQAGTEQDGTEQDGTEQDGTDPRTSDAAPNVLAPVAAAGSALAPVVGLAGLVAAVAVGLRMREERARQRRRPTQRAARAAGAVQRRTTSAAGRSTAHLAGAGRHATGSVAAVPGAVGAKGRRAKRSASRTLWKLEALSAVAAGYVAGARAGRERYEQIVQCAGQLTGRQPETPAPDQRT